MTDEELKASYLQSKKDAERLLAESARARGEHDAVLRQIKDDFGLASVAAAEKELKVAEADERKARADFDKAEKSFQKQWGPKAEELDADHD